VVDISSDDTACLYLVLLISRRSFLDERDRAADQGLRALEVLEEIVLIDLRIAIVASREWLDLTIVVRWGQGVAPAGPDWHRDLRWVEKGVELRSGKVASVRLVSPEVYVKLVFSACIYSSDLTHESDGVIGQLIHHDMEFTTITSFSVASGESRHVDFFCWYIFDLMFFGV